MKKVLLFGLIVSLGLSSSAFASYGYLSAPNEGNLPFATLQRHKFEKEETLDFADNPEAYKEKRERKERFLDYQEGKVAIPRSVQTQYNLQSSPRPGVNNMQFIKDENGRIKIQSY